MFCKRCGKELEDTLKFCKYCGEPTKSIDTVEDSPTFSKKKRGVLWKIKIFFGFFLILAALIGIGIGSYYFSDTQKLNRSIRFEEWEQAATIYTDMLSEGKEESAEKQIRTYIGEVKSRYIDQEILLEEALDLLLGARKIGALNEEIDEVEKYIETLAESRTAYELAEKYWEEKDYENALRQYQNVKDIDENYPDAIDKSVEAKKLYKDQISETAKELAEEGNYEEAMAKISSAQQILGNDADLTVLVTQYGKALLEKRLDEYEGAEDYKGAISLLEQYSATVENESDLQTRKEVIIGKYKEKLFEMAKNAYAETGYEESVRILNDGLQVLPGDEKIQEQIEVYMGCMPVDIQTLTVLSTQSSSSLSSGYTNSSIKDLYDNEYQGYFGFRLGSGLPKLKYIEFFSNKQYSHFHGKIFITSGTNKKFTAKLTVYADGVEVYDSGYIDRETKAIEFDIPINYAERLKIEASTGDSARLILTDAKVYNILE